MYSFLKAQPSARVRWKQGLTILRRAGYPLDPEALHTHAIGNGWRASNAEKLREVAMRINEGRVIQGMKSAPLRDDVLDYWRERAANGSGRDEQ